MFPLVLTVLLVPAVILADTQCTSGDISCPEGKTCCMVDGRQSCCDEDLEDKPLHTTFLAPNDTDIVIQNSTWGCDYRSCFGTCCNGGCCPYVMANCCSGTKCCESGSPCCGSGCCERFSTCCSGYGCCGFGSTCCGNGCCPLMSKCCGSWCCKSNQRCGGYKKCINAAASLVPTATVVAAVLLGLAVKRVTWM